MSIRPCLRSGFRAETGKNPRTTSQRHSMAQTSPIGSPRRRRRHFSNEEMENIRPHFTQYYLEDYTYEEIMFAMRDHHKFVAG
jgi:hypothetical protein